jgi:hypothetical protein
MTREKLEFYIRQKLEDLDKQKDMQDVINKGKLSFGIDSTTYSHLPAWPALVRESKQLKKLFWVEVFFIAFMTLLMGGNYFENGVWWKDLIRLIISAGIAMIFGVAVYYFSFFVRVRRTEREVRKLIYQDILFQLNKEGKEIA